MYHHEAAGRKKARDLITRTGHHLGKLGGHMRKSGYEPLDDEAADKKLIKRALAEHDAQLHPGHHTRLKLAEGGIADGGEPRMRGDRGHRGSKGAKNHIAIVLAPQMGQPAAPRPPMPPPPRPMPPPNALPPPPPRPMAGPPPGPIGAPAPMGMTPPGAVPPGLPMRKAGGRAGRHRAVSTAATMDENVPRPKKFPEMDGAERDPRRIETAAAQDDDFMPGEKRGGRARRRDGGRTPHMTAGSDSGEGRLQKSRDLDYCAGGRA